MKRKKHDSNGHSDRWLVSYADFITLLFAFFVVLYASSQVDHQRMSAMGSAIEHAFQELGVMQDRGPSAGNASTGKLPGAGSELPSTMKLKREAELRRLQQHLEKVLAQEIRDRCSRPPAGSRWVGDQLAGFGILQQRLGHHAARCATSLLANHCCLARI